MAYYSKLNLKFIVTTVLAIIFVVFVSQGSIEAEEHTQFTDIESVSGWAGDGIFYLVGKGVIEGDGRGKFNPNGALTRGEAAKILSLSLNLVINKESKASFEDTEDHWSSPYIKAIQDENEGIIRGYNDSEFRPNGKITRQEMAKMVVVAYQLELNKSADINFSDNTGWGKQEVQILASLGVVEGRSVGQFKPESEVTRAESTVFVHRTEIEAERLEVSKNPEKETNVIKGNIQEDTTWTKDESPYVITDDLQIFDNVKLTILEGTHIKIVDNAKIRVAGELEAIGTNESPVLFSSYDLKWDGIEFINSNSIIKNSLIENARQAINLTGNSVVLIDGNVFTNNEKVVTDTYGYQKMIFTNNTVKNNEYVFSGIRPNLQSVFKNNSFLNNESVFDYGYYFGEVLITDNNFINNSFVIKAPEEGYGYGEVNISNNWWDTTDINLIDHYIIDKNKDVSLQLLNYFPLQTEKINNIGSSIDY